MFLVRGFAKRVLLIDNHAQLGHVVLYLGMDGSNHHFYDLVQMSAGWTRSCSVDSSPRTPAASMFCPLLTFMAAHGKPTPTPSSGHWSS